MFKNTLVAVDGSEHGWKAAHIAGDLARALMSELWVVVAYDPMPPYYLGDVLSQKAIDERQSWADEIFAKAILEIGEIETELHREILEGPAAEAILAVADTRKVDLIIMGTRGLGRLASMLIGSQSQKVIGQANCPVMLIH